MKLFLNKHGQDSSFNKIFTAIIAIAVVVVVLVFLFKMPVLGYLKNIPSYGNGGDIEIIPGNNSTDVDVIKNLCQKRVGGILNQRIFFCRDYDFECKNKIFSKLWWDGNQNDAKIRIEQKFIFDILNPDDDVGEVKNKKINIYDEFLSEENDIILGDYEGVPTKDALIRNDFSREYVLRLDGAFYVAGNLICEDLENGQ